MILHVYVYIYIVCYMCVLIIENMKLQKEYKSIKTGHVCII